MFRSEISEKEMEVLKKSLRATREYLLKKDSPHESWTVNRFLGKIKTLEERGGSLEFENPSQKVRI